MSHAEFRREALRDHREKLSRLVGKAEGGRVSDKAEDEGMIRRAFGEHDKQLHGGKHTKLKFADGGGVEEDRGATRRDRRARGGGAGGGGKRGHKGTHVAVIVAPQGGGGGPPPPALPIAPPGGLAAPPPRPPMVMPPPGGAPVMPPGGAPGGMAGGPPVGAMAPRPPMIPPGAGMPPGGMPMRPPGVATGGRIMRARGGRAPDIEGEAVGEGEDAEDELAERGEESRRGSGAGEEFERGRSPNRTRKVADAAGKTNPFQLNKIVAPRMRARGGRAAGGAADDNDDSKGFPRSNTVPMDRRENDRDIIANPNWQNETARPALRDAKRGGRQFARGGRTEEGPLEDKAPSGENPWMNAGAGGGKGRLEKVKAYGDEADEGEGEERSRGGRAPK